MQKITKLAVAVALVVTTLLLASPGTASAGTKGCVTYSEYQRVKPGMVARRVHRIFDTHGYLVGKVRNQGRTDTWRRYRQCPGLGGRPELNFDNYSHGSRKPGGAMRLYSKEWGGGARG